VLLDTCARCLRGTTDGREVNNDESTGQISSCDEAIQGQLFLRATDRPSRVAVGAYKALESERRPGHTPSYLARPLLARLDDAIGELLIRPHSSAK